MQRQYKLFRTFLPVLMLVMTACSCWLLAEELPVPPEYYCNTLVFTEPVNSVNNGTQRFSWSLMRPALYYRLTISDEATGEVLATHEFPPSSWSTELDVSEVAIGGGDRLVLHLESAFMKYDLSNVTCTRDRIVTRQPLRVLVPEFDCTPFRLTSPLEGLPNGMATFYWDPISEATGYQISVYDGGAFLAGWDAPAGATNLPGDVSTAVIGGGYTPLTVVATAFLPNNQTCTSQATMSREASPNIEPAVPASTLEPTLGPTLEPTLPPPIS